MTILYMSTSANKLKVVDIDDATGSLRRVVQIVEPIVDPIPPTLDGTPMRSTTGFFQPVTEWVGKHPKFDLVYAVTSFWSSAPAMVTTFRITNQSTGQIVKLGSTSTCGLHAVHVTFSPDQSHLVVSHHNDGNVVFFDCTLNDALQAPVKILTIPEVIPGTRTTKLPYCLPSIQHCSYSPNGNYLLASDASPQGRVWTFPVDQSGLPTQDTPTSYFKPTIINKTMPITGILLKMALSLPDNRIRRTIVHPSGRYVYVLMELHSLLQVYEIDAHGRIWADCLQEIPTIDEAYCRNKFNWNSKWQGLGINTPSEMYATTTEVMVSNRSMNVPYLGQGESSIRIYDVKDGGAKLVVKQVLEASASVQHFWMSADNNKLYAAINMGNPSVVESFVRKRDSLEFFEKAGEANVMDVVCIAPM